MAVNSVRQFMRKVIAYVGVPVAIYTSIDILPSTSAKVNVTTNGWSASAVAEVHRDSAKTGHCSTEKGRVAVTVDLNVTVKSYSAFTEPYRLIDDKGEVLIASSLP